MGDGDGAVDDLVTANDGASLSSILEGYRGRRVLVTGHNGFVGSWLSFLLVNAGALVTGLSLPAPTGGLADLMDLREVLHAIEGDVTDTAVVHDCVQEAAPEFVFHLAAQALVLPSYDDPVHTFATNVMGTVTLLDALRHQPSVRSCVVVTSDKCYATANAAHLESDPLGGDDPYSASKAAAEIVTHAFRSSFLAHGSLAVATARAGNIVGGGDWAENRVVPDCVRAIRDGVPVQLRRPDAVRPWQHVLDAVAGYVRLGDALVRDKATFAHAWNFGPSADAEITVGELVTTMLRTWRARGVEIHEPTLTTAIEAERTTLILDSTKAHRVLGWQPLLTLDTAIEWTVEWYSAAISPTPLDARAVTARQISDFLERDRCLQRETHDVAILSDARGATP